jgi:3-isopropylmalate/(R)-2-methylmalate dehydratase small subunit
MSKMNKVWKFENNVNTDEIIPGRYNLTIVPEELAKNVFCEVRPEFSKKVNEGDIIIAGQNFGCGSSREHAPIAIKGSKIKCIIAKSYARIFFRNAINIGLVILECEKLYDQCDESDELDVNLKTGQIKNITKNLEFQAQPLPKFILKIVENGGIVNYLKNHDIDELN